MKTTQYDFESPRGFFIGFALHLFGITSVTAVGFSIYVMVAGLWKYEFAVTSVVRVIACAVPGVLYALLFSSTLKYCTQKILFTADGILFRCFGEKQRHIPWTDIQEVCICCDRTHTLLAFIKKGEKKNSANRWKVDNILRFRSVINFDYSLQIYEKLLKVCPLEIVDYRQLSKYKW